MNDSEMATAYANPSAGYRALSPEAELLLRETNHRCSNDLQLVVSLLALQSRKAASDETRQALIDTMERVAILARARASLKEERRPTLEAALRQVCEALQSQAEPRSIFLSLETASAVSGLSAVQVTTLTLIVNELATNAIKHAFAQDRSGRIRIVVRPHDSRSLTIIVDDDGLPFPEIASRTTGGLGLGLVRRLLESIGGLVILPANGSKCFEIRVPMASH